VDRRNRERPTWADWGLTIAHAVATRADCTRRQVGAVVLDTQNRVVATGYNGAPPGERGCLDGGCPRGRLSFEQCEPYSGYDNCISNHAEVNALLYGDRSKVDGGTLYVTDEPCLSCCKVIANSGVARVVWDTPLGWNSGTPQELFGKHFA
jgi:dCMP deaminase